MDMLTLSAELLARCMEAAQLLQRDLASLLGVSERTVHRWLNGRSGMVSADQIHALARAVHAGDPALARELAASVGTTVEALGLVAPAVAPALPPPAAATLAVAPLAAALSAALIDSIVFAAADLQDLPPRQVRPLVAAAFARAHALGLSTEAVARGLASEPPPAKPE